MWRARARVHMGPLPPREEGRLRSYWKQMVSEFVSPVERRTVAQCWRLNPSPPGNMHVAFAD